MILTFTSYFNLNLEVSFQKIFLVYILPYTTYLELTFPVSILIYGANVVDFHLNVFSNNRCKSWLLFNIRHNSNLFLARIRPWIFYIEMYPSIFCFISSQELCIILQAMKTTLIYLIQFNSVMKFIITTSLYRTTFAARIVLLVYFNSFPR